MHHLPTLPTYAAHSSAELWAPVPFGTGLRYTKVGEEVLRGWTQGVASMAKLQPPIAPYTNRS